MERPSFKELFGYGSVGFIVICCAAALIIKALV
jgi:hypothetical protein